MIFFKVNAVHVLLQESLVNITKLSAILAVSASMHNCCNTCVAEVDIDKTTETFGKSISVDVQAQASCSRTSYEK